MLYITFCVDVQTRPHVYERVGALFNIRDQQVDRWLSILPSEDHNEQQAICLIGRSLLKRLALATAFALALVAAGCTGSGLRRIPNVRRTPTFCCETNFCSEV